ncbi:MAG: DMT family transporter [Ignavibacteriaceae bacterium]|nr:DMT family transporter [Ignavibacteriaceae bacterium]
MPVGELFALLTALLWSGTALCFAEASRRIGTYQLNINRLLIATIFLSITILIGGLNFHLTSEQVLYLAASGIVGLVFGDTFLFKAYQEVGPRNAMLVMSLSPGMAAIMSYFLFGETISAIGITGIVVTLGGVAYVVYGRNPASSKEHISANGLWLSLLGALGQAGGLVLAKMAFNISDINGFVATFYRIFFSVIILFIMGVTTRIYKNPVTLFREQVTAFKFTLAGAIMGPFLGITASLIAISTAKVGIASTLMSIVPVTMLPLVYIFYKEKIPVKGIIGAVIAVAGVAILVLR